MSFNTLRGEVFLLSTDNSYETLRNKLNLNYFPYVQMNKMGYKIQQVKATQ